MTDKQKPRIWISNANPEHGELVRVRAVIVHRMETGLRLNQQGDVVDRNIVNKFTAKLDDQLLLEWEPETAIAQNPFIEFTFIARKSGTLSMRWVDDKQETIIGQTDITVT
jgi:sulfur-oxidizing protein SoxZ